MFYSCVSLRKTQNWSVQGFKLEEDNVTGRAVATTILKLSSTSHSIHLLSIAINFGKLKTLWADIFHVVQEAGIGQNICRIYY